jgi:CxxC-x17-CxxC domain-containing protein
VAAAEADRRQPELIFTTEDTEEMQTNQPYEPTNNGFADKHLICVECHEGFTFTAGEQKYFRDKGLENEPRRCKRCKADQRARREAAAGQNGGVRTQRVDTVVNCARCGCQTTVPFVPTGARPVYCRACFSAQ